MHIIRLWAIWFIRTSSVSSFVAEPSSSKTSYMIALSVTTGSVLVRESSTETISLVVVPSEKNLGLYTANLFKCSWRSLKGLPASGKALDCFFSNYSFFETVNNSFGCNLSPTNLKHLRSIKSGEFWK